MRRLKFIAFENPAAGSPFIGVVPALAGFLTRIIAIRCDVDAGAAIRIVTLRLEDQRSPGLSKLDLHGPTIGVNVICQMTWGIGLQGGANAILDENWNGELPSEWMSENNLTITITTGGNLTLPSVWFDYLPITA